MIRSPEHYEALSRLAVVLNVAHVSEFERYSVEWLEIAGMLALDGHVMPELAKNVERVLERRRAGLIPVLNVTEFSDFDRYNVEWFAVARKMSNL